MAKYISGGIHLPHAPPIISVAVEAPKSRPAPLVEIEVLPPENLSATEGFESVLGHKDIQDSDFALPPTAKPAKPAEPRAFEGNAGFAGFAEGVNGESEFPLECLPPVLVNIAREVGRAALVPTCLTAGCALAAVSVALGAGLCIDTGAGSPLRGNTFFLMVASSGTGKGRSFNMVMEPLLKKERDFAMNWDNEVRPGLDAEIEIVKWDIEKAKARNKKAKNEIEHDQIVLDVSALNEKLAKLEAQRVVPLWTCGDMTREAMAVALDSSPREALGSISSEARGIVDVVCGRYNEKGDEDILLSGFSGDPCKVNRIGRASVNLENPCLSVAWMIQPDKLRTMLSNSALTESGLLPRFLVFDTHATPQHEPEHRHAVLPAVSKAWAELIGALVDNYHEASDSALIVPTQQIRAHFRNFFNSIVDRRKPGGDLADVNSYAARWNEQALRATVILHAAEHGNNASVEPLRETTALNAIKLIQWFATEQLKVLENGRRLAKLERLERVIAILLAAPGRTRTLRVMRDNHGFAKEEIESIAAQSEGRLIVETRKIGETGGRPSAVVRMA